MSRDKSGKNNGEDMFGPEPWTLWYKKHTRLIAVCTLVIVAAVLLWFFWPHGHGDNSTNQVAQKTLETSLAAAESNTNDQEIINITGQLIDGANTGTYRIDNETLAKYHMARATSNINLKKYGTVAKDCEAAAKLSDKYKKAALEFEFQARYYLGERQQLIPLLNQIIAIEKTSTNPMRGSIIGQYQEYIADIQQNKELPF